MQAHSGAGAGTYRRKCRHIKAQVGADIYSRRHIKAQAHLQAPQAQARRYIQAQVHARTRRRRRHICIQAEVQAHTTGGGACTYRRRYRHIQAQAHTGRGAGTYRRRRVRMHIQA